MDEVHKEILRMLQEMFDATERRITESYDRIDNSIAKCRLAMGGAAPSSTTSTGTDLCSYAPSPDTVCSVAEVPVPADCNPDAILVVATDVEDLATPTPTRCSTEGLSRGTTDLRSASDPVMAPTTPTAMDDINPVSGAPAGSDDQTISDVVLTAATCSMVCLPRHAVAAPVLVVSAPPTTTKYVLDSNNIDVAAVPLAMTGACREVLVPTASTPTAQLQHLYHDCEFFSSSSSQHVTSKSTVRRPFPWPSLLDAQANGDDTHPLPWPSFMEDYGCEFPSVDLKPFRQCNSDNSNAKSCAAIEFQISGFWGLHQFYNDSELFSLSSSQCITSKVLVHRPMPWPSFMGAHADGDETRPLPWPSLAYDIGPVQQESGSPFVDRAPLSIWLVLNGNHSTSYGYIIGNVLCSPCEIWYSEILFMWFQRCLSDILNRLVTVPGVGICWGMRLSVIEMLGVALTFSTPLRPAVNAVVGFFIFLALSCSSNRITLLENLVSLCWKLISLVTKTLSLLSEGTSINSLLMSRIATSVKRTSTDYPSLSSNEQMTVNGIILVHVVLQITSMSG